MTLHTLDFQCPVNYYKPDTYHSGLPIDSQEIESTGVSCGYRQSHKTFPLYALIIKMKIFVIPFIMNSPVYWKVWKGEFPTHLSSVE